MDKQQITFVPSLYFKFVITSQRRWFKDHFSRAKREISLQGSGPLKFVAAFLPILFPVFFALLVSLRLKMKCSQFYLTIPNSRIFASRRWGNTLKSVTGNFSTFCRRTWSRWCSENSSESSTSRCRSATTEPRPPPPPSPSWFEAGGQILKLDMT